MSDSLDDGNGLYLVCINFNILVVVFYYRATNCPLLKKTW